ncbi:MAG: hypothetical protein QOF48_652 [Verrucomicrobiota bacterium]
MRYTFVLFLVLLGMATFSGCATDEASENASARPWNQPRGWEHGLPSSINEGR